MQMKKPHRLSKGDTVAIVSPSWGGPEAFPAIYENGLKVLKEWGLVIKEYPTAKANNEFLSKNPEARAKDINDAFADTEIKAVFASIGGDDSVRILPFLNADIITNNPKILIGYSDTTTLLAFGALNGMVTFHGPSIMAGFSQMESLPQSFMAHVHSMLFTPNDHLDYVPYGQYCDGYLDWSQPENLGKTKELKRDRGWRVIQGKGVVEGHLFGGSLEVLEFIKGTEFWPDKSFWKGKILFFETSEEKPTLDFVRRSLRNYGIQGVFDNATAILFGRARDYSDEEKLQFDDTVREVISGEFRQPDLPIMTNMDFGHTDPQIVLPLGVAAKVDLSSKKLCLTEAWLK